MATSEGQLQARYRDRQEPIARVGEVEVLKEGAHARSQGRRNRVR